MAGSSQQEYQMGQMGVRRMLRNNNQAAVSRIYHRMLKQNKVRKNSADAFGKNAEAKKEIRRAVLFLFFGRILFDTGIFRVKQIGEIIQ